jgi:hypothetical protein
LEVRVIDLVQRHRADVAQLVGAEGPGGGVRGQGLSLLHHGLTGRDLASMSGAHDPGRLVDRQANQTGSGLSHLTDGPAHANPNPSVGGPTLRLNAALRVNRTPDCRGRRREITNSESPSVRSTTRTVPLQ